MAKVLPTQPPSRGFGSLFGPVPLQPRSAGPLPAPFRKRSSASALTNAFITDCRFNSGSPNIIGVPSMCLNQKEALKRRANQQHKEIMSWLAMENPTAQELLTRLSTCCTRYSGLLRMTAEELEYVFHASARDGHRRRQQAELDAGERATDVAKAASVLEKVRQKNAKLKARLGSQQETLKRLGEEIAGVRHLMSLSGLDSARGREVRTAMRSVATTRENEPVTKAEAAAQSQEDYAILWAEEENLKEELAGREAELRRAQQEQVMMLREYAKKRLVR